MNSADSQTYKPQVLMLDLTDKIDLWIGEESIALPNLSIYYVWKYIESSYNNNKFKNQFLLQMINLSYQMDHIGVIGWTILIIFQ